MSGIENSEAIRNEDIHGLQLDNSEQLSSYIETQKKRLESITNKDLLNQAEQELQELESGLESAKQEISEVSKLRIEDLKQEFERDIKGMKLLENTDISSVLPVKQLTEYIHNLGESEEEKIYSILSTISSNVLQSFIIDFNINTVFMDEDDTENKVLSEDNIEDFVGEFLVNFESTVESQEVEELQNLSIDENTTIQEIEYYQQQIESIKSSVSEDVQIILDTKNTELNIQKTELLEVEVSEKEEEVSEKEEEKISIFKKEYSDISEQLSDKNQYGELHKEYSNIISIFKAIENTDEKDITGLENLQKDLTKAFEQTITLEDGREVTVAEQFLLDLGKKNPELYNTMLHTIRELSPTLAMSLQHLSDIPRIVEKGGLDDGGDYALNATLGEGFEVSGDIAQLDNKYVDLSQEPPQSYIKLGNGFRLNSTVEQDIFSETKIFQDEINDLQDSLSDLQNRKSTLNRIIEKYSELKNNTDEESKNLVKKIDTQYPNLEMQVQELSEQEQTIQKQIQEKQQEYNMLVSQYKESVKEQDEKTTEILEFLEGLGFNLIPQSISQSIMDQLNSSGGTGVRNQMGFNTKFDLNNGVLGYENSFDKNNITLTEKVIFGEFMNRMISGDKNQPIDIKIILAGGNNPIDLNDLNIILQESGLKDSGTGISVAMTNIDKSLQESETSKKL